MKIFYNDSTNVFFTKNNKSRSKNKHVDIKFFIVRDHIKKQEVIIEHINTELMIDDPMTKDCPQKSFRIMQLIWDSVAYSRLFLIP